MDKIIMRGNINRGLFLSTREDYIQKIERLSRMVEELHPELSESVHTEIHDLYREGSLYELVEFHDKLYKTVKDFYIPTYRPHWMFKTKFYS
jgi:hypothetical protein